MTRVVWLGPILVPQNEGVSAAASSNLLLVGVADWGKGKVKEILWES